MAYSAGKFLKTMLTAMLAGVCLLAVSCRKERTMEMPKVRSDLVLDIFHDFDRKDYEAVQPKIARYMAIDETNIFLNELQNLVTNNIAVVQARTLADQGDYAGAHKVISDAIADHGEQKDLLLARMRLNELLNLKEQIQLLKQPLRAKEMQIAAKKLLAFAHHWNRSKLIDFANKKLEEADRIEQIENDRAKFGIFADAMNAAAAGDQAQAASLAALLKQTDPHYPGIEMLQNGGLFDKPEPEVKPEVKNEKEGTERSDL